MSEAAKVWNKDPDKIRVAKTLTAAKMAIREHCKSLPIRISNTFIRTRNCYICAQGTNKQL